jgi:hypothetical protein
MLIALRGKNDLFGIERRHGVFKVFLSAASYGPLY